MSNLIYSAWWRTSAVSTVPQPAENMMLFHCAASISAKRGGCLGTGDQTIPKYFILGFIKSLAKSGGFMIIPRGSLILERWLRSSLNVWLSNLWSQGEFYSYWSNRMALLRHIFNVGGEDRGTESFSPELQQSWNQLQIQPVSLITVRSVNLPQSSSTVHLMSSVCVCEARVSTSMIRKAIFTIT